MSSEYVDKMMDTMLETVLPKPTKWNLVLVFADASSSVLLYDSVEALVARLQDIAKDNVPDQPTHVYIFTGQRVFLSSGDPKRLLLPERDPIPLYPEDDIDPNSPDASGVWSS